MSNSEQNKEVRRPTGLATSSFALGISSFFAPLLFNSLASIILGHIANKKNNSISTNRLERGFAMTGLIFGYISLTLTIVIAIGILLLFLLLPNLITTITEQLFGMFSFPIDLPFLEGVK